MSEVGDWLGDSLSSGDFNNDSRHALAIGVPYEDIGRIGNAGAVNVLYGSSGGLNAAGDQVWYQDVPGVEGTSEASDRFGFALTE